MTAGRLGGLPLPTGVPIGSSFPGRCAVTASARTTTRSTTTRRAARHAAARRATSPVRKMDGYEAGTDTAWCTTAYAAGEPPQATGGSEVMGYHGAREILNDWPNAQHLSCRTACRGDRGWSVSAHLFLVSAWRPVRERDPMSAAARDRRADRCSVRLPAGAAPVDRPHLPAPRQQCRGATTSRRAQPTGRRAWSPTRALNATASGTGTRCRASRRARDRPEAQHPAAERYFTRRGRARCRRSLARPERARSASTRSARCHQPGQGDAAGQRRDASPDWSSTAIFVAWDDWGGVYDHVAPPGVDVNGYGLRVPGLVIRPYAQRGYDRPPDAVVRRVCQVHGRHRPTAERPAIPPIWTNLTGRITQYGARALTFANF